MAFELPTHLPKRPQSVEPSTLLLSTIAELPLDDFTTVQTNQWLMGLNLTLIENKGELHWTVQDCASDLSEQLQRAKAALRAVENITTRQGDRTNELHGSDAGLTHGLANALSFHAALTQEFQNILTAQSATRYLHACTSEYQAVRTFMQHGQIVEAYHACRTLQGKVTHEHPDFLQTSKYFQELKKNVRIISDRLYEQLSMACDFAVRVHKEGNTSFLTIRTLLSSPSAEQDSKLGFPITTTLASLLHSLPEDSLETMLKKLRKDLVSYFIEPVFSSNYGLDKVEDDCVLRLNLDHVHRAESPLPTVTRILSFLSDHFLPSLPSNHRIAFPLSLYAPVATLLLELHLQRDLPRVLSALPAFLVIARKAVEFEEAMQKTGFCDKEDIQKWVAGVDIHYERKRAEFYVEESRALFRNSDNREAVRIDKRLSNFVMHNVSEAPTQEDPDEDSWGFSNDENTESINNPAEDKSTTQAPQDPSGNVETDEWDWDDEDGDVNLQSVASDGPLAPRHINAGLSVGKSDSAVHEQAKTEKSLSSKVQRSNENERGQPTDRLVRDETTRMVSASVIALGELVQSAVSEGQELEASLIFSELRNPDERKTGDILLRTAPALLELAQALNPLQECQESSALLRQSNDFTYLVDISRRLSNQLASAPGSRERVRWDETVASLEITVRELIDRAVNQEVAALDYTLKIARPFVDIMNNTHYETVRRAFKTLLGNVRNTAHEWKSIIPSTIYLDSLGKVVDAVFTRVVDSIVGLDDITESESQRLAELCKILEPIQTLFVDTHGNAQTGAYVRSWFRFSYLAELLVASIADISYLFEEGMLVDYDTTEITKLLRALFAESQLREKAIRRIEQGHPLKSVSG